MLHQVFTRIKNPKIGKSLDQCPALALTKKLPQQLDTALLFFIRVYHILKAKKNNYLAATQLYFNIKFIAISGGHL